ncbi:hypothetical protein PO909_018954 [Leuciscus waleckii]
MSCYSSTDKEDEDDDDDVLSACCFKLSAAADVVLNTVAIASIHFPLAFPQSEENSTCKLQLIVFRNGKLFPCTGNSSNLADDGKRRSVSTPVAFTKLDGCSPGSPVQPVTVALRHFSLGVDPTAAYWDFDLLDGHGGWRAEGCQITGSAHNTTTIHCAHHNNLAVLMRNGIGSSVVARAHRRRMFTEDWDSIDWECDAQGNSE